MPPDRGIPLPNSSITRAPQAEMIPATTQRISDKPTLPESLKIVDGVEKILLAVSDSQDLDSNGGVGGNINGPTQRQLSY